MRIFKKKEKRQGNRTDLDKKKWGRLKRISPENRLTTSSEYNKNQTYTLIKADGGFAYATSGAINIKGVPIPTPLETYYKSLISIRNAVQEEINKIENAHPFLKN